MVGLPRPPPGAPTGPIPGSCDGLETHARPGGGVAGSGPFRIEAMNREVANPAHILIARAGRGP